MRISAKTQRGFGDAKFVPAPVLACDAYLMKSSRIHITLQSGTLLNSICSVTLLAPAVLALRRDAHLCSKES